MLFDLGQRTSVNDKYFIIDSDGEDHLNPLATCTSADGPIFVVSRSSVSTGTNHLFTFFHCDAVLGGMV
jgi:hypothetical protein